MHIKNLHLDILSKPRTGRSDAGRSDIRIWRRSISAAISLVKDCCVEGFALHVTSLHPEIFLSPRENEGHAFEQPQFEQPQRRQAVPKSSFERRLRSRRALARIFGFLSQARSRQ